MILTSDIIRSVQGEADAQAVYREVRKTGERGTLWRRIRSCGEAGNGDGPEDRV